MSTESPAVDAPPLPPPAAPAPPARRASPALVAAFVAALAAIALAVWQWLDTRAELRALTQEVGRRLSDADAAAKASRSAAESAQEALRQTQARLAGVENRLAESQSQQVALEALYQDLSRNRDELVVAEVEQMLLIASQQLQLAGNVKAALLALQTADHRLQHVDKPQLLALRKAIDKDIERLSATPFVDMTGISLRIDNLIDLVDKLPLAAEARPVREQSAAAAPAGFWQKMAWEAWQDFKGLVRIQNTQKPDMPLLAPNQIFFLRENLKLRLLSARLALLARDEKSFSADLKSAQEWLDRYYDPQDKNVAAMRAALHQVGSAEFGADDLPDISASLETARRLARERGAR